MIFVDRSRIEVPEPLRSARAQRERERLHDLLRSATAEHLSQLRPTFDQSIWIEARPHLQQLFSNKCAYCEESRPYSPLDVEPYRPLRRAISDRSKSEAGPRSTRGHLYYAWLAYEWDNLLLMCVECNRNRGRDLAFDVLGGRAPFLADVAECRRAEVPLLLDPCYDKPSDHLACVEGGELVPQSERGKFTISALDLNRESLVTRRAEAWAETEDAVRSFLVSVGRDGEPAIQLLVRALRSEREFLLARRCAFDRRADAFTALGFDISPFEQLLADGGAARLANVGNTPFLRETRMGRYMGKKMLPERPTQVIRRIAIRNFKAIEELDIEVPEAPRSVDKVPGGLALLGENATGKSSILEAVALAVLGTDQIARLKLDGRERLHRGRHGHAGTNASQPAEVVLTLDSGEDLQLVIDVDGQFRGSRKRAAVLLGYGPRRYFSRRRNVRRLQEPWHRVKSMFDPLVRLPDPTRWLLSCSKRDFDRVVRALRTMLLLPDEALVRRGVVPGASGEPTVYFELDGRHESLDTLSEGYKTVIAMGVDIMRELLDYWPDLEIAQGIVLVDELDTHLHPRWKMRIAQRLRRALPGVQFIASTHDPLCLRGYFQDEVQVLRRTASGSVERVLDLPSVQGLSVEQLLTSEYFGLFSTEDPALDESIARYSTLVAKSDRTEAEEAELQAQRAEVGETLVLGTGPGERIVQDAIREYLVQRQQMPSLEVAQLRRDAVAKVVEFWNSVEPDPRPSPEGPGTASAGSPT